MKRFKIKHTIAQVFKTCAAIKGKTKQTFFEIFNKFYIRDAGGNIISVYEKNAALQLEQTEIPVYGSGRLGMAQAAGGSVVKYAYELTDHLGNVRATITENNGQAQLLNTTDYYPFGWEIPNRNSIAEPYRFGYQGQFAEKDPETGLNQFEARLFDSRAGRWLTTDPAGQYWSPYLGMGNNPIIYIDANGNVDFPALADATLGVLGGTGEVTLALGCGSTGLGAVAGVVLGIDGATRISLNTQKFIKALIDDPKSPASEQPTNLGEVTGAIIDIATDNENKAFQKTFGITNDVATFTMTLGNALAWKNLIIGNIKDKVAGLSTIGNNYFSILKNSGAFEVKPKEIDAAYVVYDTKAHQQIRVSDSYPNEQ